MAIENHSGDLLLETPGAGINYKLQKCIELEFGVPYIYGMNVTNTEDTKLFSGVAFNFGMNFVFTTRDMQKMKDKHHERLIEKWEKE